MNEKTLKVLVGGAAMIGGAAVGTFIGRTVMQKAPQYEPLLIWTSGVLIGGAVATMLAPRFISKSTAGAILASSD